MCFIAYGKSDSLTFRPTTSSDTCWEHAIGMTVQWRRWRLISHIATLSFPALTISSPIVLSSDPGFCSFVPHILSSQSYILARYLLLFAPLFVMVQDVHSRGGEMPPELLGQSHPLPPPNPPQNQPGSSSLPLSQLPSQQLTPLFISQETIDQLAKSKDESSKLPPLVPHQ